MASANAHARHLATGIDKRREGKQTAAHALLGFLSALAMLSHAEATIITADANSERVTLPSPATPNLAAARSGCPHEAAQLIPWHDPAAWTGGAVPATAGEAATLATGVSVLLQGEPAGAGKFGERGGERAAARWGESAERQRALCGWCCSCGRGIG